MSIRENLSTSKEVQDIIIADLALTVAFALVLSGGVAGVRQDFNTFLYFVPISFVAVSFSFVLHELMHKFAAQHFGAAAAFRRSDNGILITLISSMLGILIGIPGATMIYAMRFTKEEEGYVALAGPLTNFAVFIGFFGLSFLVPSSGFLHDTVDITMLISLIIAFFNMLPVYPLDGSKVIRWNFTTYFAVEAIIFILLIVVVPAVTMISVETLIIELAFMLVFALVISMFFRGIRL